VCRLPSEAEWEYGCRAGTKTPFCFGGTITTDQANFDGTDSYGSSPEGEYRKNTTAVGIFPANGWGLRDMHGNVWEWCADWFMEDPGGLGHADPTGPASGEARVVRGGGWGFFPWRCRSALRLWSGPVIRSGVVGFRVAVDIK
jgi:formylglycine-generating enzyme required for sulfatase activity